MGGGFSSTALMPRVLLALYDVKDVHFVTCVLPNEHPSMWELFDSVEKELKISVTYIAYDPITKYTLVSKEDRTNKEKLYTPFDIFNDTKFIGNSRTDPCSRILKRETIKHYILNVFPDKKNHALAIGISENEIERLLNIRTNYTKLGYTTMFPLEGFDLTTVNKIEKIKQWYNVDMPLYSLEFEHNNCGGACVKAGQRQWAKLWYYFPEVYSEWENNEKEWRKVNGNYSILKKRINKTTIYITLEQFRKDYLEPALNNGSPQMFINKYIQSLESGPICRWCEAI
jgi:hypothetical protein